MGSFILVLFAAILFGLSTPLSKTQLSVWSPQQLAGLLYLGAALGAVVPILVSRKAFWPNTIGRANLFRLAGAVFFGGILGPLFLLIGLRFASASSVSLWLNLEMVATAILGTVLFKDHLGKYGLMGATSVFVAGLLLSWGEGSAGLKAGLFLGLACLCWGIDNNLTSLIDGLLPIQSTFWKGLIAGMFNFGLGLFLSPQIPPLVNWIPALTTGIFCYGVSIIFYVSASQNLGATRSQMVFASAPIFGLLASYVWLREPLSAYHFLAMGFQLLGTVLLFKDKHAHAHSHEAMEHSHSHAHNDGHHTHAHPGMSPELRHSHAHKHESHSHAHPHWPDIHHRHAH